MTKVELKTSIKNLVNKIDDEKVLKAYHTLLNSMIEEKIIGFTAKGEALTEKTLVKKVKEASARVKSGKYISHEEAVKQSLKW